VISLQDLFFGVDALTNEAEDDCLVSDNKEAEERWGGQQELSATVPPQCGSPQPRCPVGNLFPDGCLSCHTGTFSEFSRAHTYPASVSNIYGWVPFVYLAEFGIAVL
jgi:hypothetical protein